MVLKDKKHHSYEIYLYHTYKYIRDNGKNKGSFQLECVFLPWKQNSVLKLILNPGMVVSIT